MNNFLAISAAQAAYVRCLDEGPIEAWPDFFVEDCRYLITTAANHRESLPAGLIWIDSKGMLRDRISALKHANIYERHSYRHLLGQAYIFDESGGEARSETAFLVIRITRDGRSDIFASGRYIDRYQISAGSALLVERTVVCDSSQIDTLLAMPL